MSRYEHWKIVPSEPTWLASNIGRIQKVPTKVAMPNGGHKIVQVIPTFGCLDEAKQRFRSCINGRSRDVAPLICEAFNGPKPASNYECMHLDENSKNNTAENLQWGSRSQNQKAPRLQAERRRRLRSYHPRRTLSDRQVEDIRRLRGISGSRDVALMFGVSRGYIYQLWSGRGRSVPNA